MKKNKKIIKLSKIQKKNKKQGIGSLYVTKLRALLGTKQLKNNYIYSIDYTNIQSNQVKSYLNLKQAALKIRTINISNNTYKGVRLKLRLPLRGQRTHTNAQTAKKLNQNND